MSNMKLPLTKTQEWIARNALIPGADGSLNLSCGFLLKGNYDINRMDTAVRKMYARHDCMRMVFKVEDDNLFLQVDDSISLGLNVIELKGGDRDSRYEEAMADAQQKVRTPLLYSTDGMYRFFAYELSDDELMLFCVINHAVTDGASMSIMNHELELLYENPERDDLPPLKGFADFLAERGALTKTAEWNEKAEYWRRQIEDYRIPSLTPLGSADSRPTMDYGAFMLETEKLRKIAGASRTSNFNIIFLLTQLALAKKTGKNDIVMHYVWANRFALDYQNTIGFVSYTVPFRLKFALTDKWNDLNTALKKQLNEDSRHLDTADAADIQEYAISYSPMAITKKSNNFADLEYTPFGLNSTSEFHGRYLGFVCVELMNDMVLMTPYCDSNVYGKDFILDLADIIKTFFNKLSENTNISIDELFEEASDTAKEDIYEMLAQQWQDVLNLNEKPKGDDDFFSLGGNSYNAFLIMGNLPEKYQGILEMSDFYDCETLSEMVDCIAERMEQK